MMHLDFKRWGWPALAGVILLIAAAASVFMGRRWQGETAALQEQGRSLVTQLKSQPAANAAGRPLDRPAWLASLPPGSARQQRLADLLELAIRQGLVITRTEHRLSVDADAGLERLGVNMPVSGSYAQLRGFIELALSQDPALSLDSLKLQRANAQAAQLDADLLWSLHARCGS
ncbi:GspMb/PilO family protein [Burkholderiaceae bacterium UC74_6]